MMPQNDFLNESLQVQECNSTALTNISKYNHAPNIISNATEILLETKNLENLLVKIEEGIRFNIESIRTRTKKLVNSMEQRIKPMIATLSQRKKKTLAVVKTDQQE